MFQKSLLISCAVILAVGSHSRADDPNADLAAALLAIRETTVVGHPSGAGTAMVSGELRDVERKATLDSIQPHLVDFIFLEDWSRFRTFAAADVERTHPLSATLAEDNRTLVYRDAAEQAELRAIQAEARTQGYHEPENWTYAGFFCIPGTAGRDERFIKAIFAQGAIKRTGNVMEASVVHQGAGPAAPYSSCKLSFDMTLGGALTEFRTEDVYPVDRRQMRLTTIINSKWIRKGDAVLPSRRDVSVTLCDANDPKRVVQSASLAVVFREFVDKSIEKGEFSVSSLHIPDGTDVYDLITKDHLRYAVGDSDSRFFDRPSVPTQPSQR